MQEQQQKQQRRAKEQTRRPARRPVIPTRPSPPHATLVQRMKRVEEEVQRARGVKGDSAGAQVGWRAQQLWRRVEHLCVRLWSAIAAGELVVSGG